MVYFSASIIGAIAVEGSVSTTQQQPAVSDLLAAIGERRDRAAFADLFALYAPRLGAFFRSLGADAGKAEELVQEVMLTIWHRAEHYDPGQGSANTWIFTVARNKRIDAFRRERRPEVDPNDPMLVPDSEPSPHLQACLIIARGPEGCGRDF